MFQPLTELALAALLVGGAAVDRDIWLLAFQPFTGGVWDAGISMRIGAEIMLGEINANPSLLPGFNLRVVWQDDTCEGAAAQDLYLENLVLRRYKAFAPGRGLGALDTDRDGVITTADVVPLEEVWNSSTVTTGPVGLLGPGCSAVGERILRMLPVVRMPVVSNSASRPSFSDRTVYPNFFRAHMPDTLFSPAWMAITKDLGISSAVVMLSDVGFSAVASVSVAAAQSQDVRLVGNSFEDDVPGFRGIRVEELNRRSAEKAGSDLMTYRQRVVILNLYARALRVVLCEAHKLRFMNAVYMVVGWLAFGWWAVEDVDCSPEQLAGMVVGSVGAAQQYFRTDASVRLSCSTSMTAQGFTEEWWRRQNTTPGDYSMRPQGFTPRSEATTTADAVCVFAQALHELLFVRGVPLPDLQERTPSAYAAMIDAFERTYFEGVSSSIRFPPGSSDVLGTVLLRQLQYSAGGALALADVATFREGLHYLGRSNLVFQFPGETFPAGPAGASSIGASLGEFAACPGDKVVDTSTNRCIDCPGNTTRVGAVQVCECAVGSFGIAAGCEPCPAGTFSTAVGASKCQPCGVGTFSPPGASECTFCPRGHFADEQGLGFCRSCPPLQTTLDIASSGEGACICDTGAYRSGGGCRSCPARATTRGPGSSNLSSCLCEPNTYMNAGACSSCPSGSSTTGRGRQSVRSCLCKDGTYMPLGARGCLPCPAGMLCPRGSNAANAAFIAVATKSEEQEFPRLQRRFWASLADPMSVFECRSELKCPGNRYPGDACAPNLHGQSCHFCAKGYSWGGERCQPCSGLEGSVLVFALVPALAIPVALVLLHRLFRGGAYEKWGSWKNGVGTVVFLVLNHYQLIDSIGDCNVVFPRFVEHVFGIWAPTNDATVFFPLDCLGLSGVKSSIIVRGVIPIVVGAFCVLTYGCSLIASRLAPRMAMERDRLLNIYGTLLFTFFNAITSHSLMLFKCKDNPNRMQSLAVDASVVCFSSGEWRGLLALTVVLVLVYIVGVGGLFVRAVVVAPRYFHDPGFQTRWRFLFIKYRTDVYWWGIAYLAQNFLVQFSFVVASEGVLQLYATMFVSFVYMFLVMLENPYRHRLASFLDVIVRGSIVFTAALFTWHVERSGSSPWVGGLVDGSAVGVSFMPALLGLVACLHLWMFGKHCPASPEEERRAREEFTQMLDNVTELTLLDDAEGAKLMLSLGEWDGWYLRRGMLAISQDVLGARGSARIVDRTLSDRVLGQVRGRSRRSVEQAVAGRVSRLASNLHRGMPDETVSTAADARGPDADTVLDSARIEARIPSTAQDGGPAQDGTGSESSFGFSV